MYISQTIGINKEESNYRLPAISRSQVGLVRVKSDVALSPRILPLKILVYQPSNVFLSNIKHA